MGQQRDGRSGPGDGSVVARLSRGLRRLWAGPARPAAPAWRPRTREEFELWLVERIADRVGASPEDIDPELPFTDSGMDSRSALGLSGELEALIDRRLSPSLAWEYPSPRELAAYLAGPPPRPAAMSEAVPDEV